MEIAPKYKKIFKLSKAEKLDHDARMISFRVLSEVEKVCDKKGITNADLAKLLGTSRSYITQLFRGTRSVNTSLMSRIENALNITFQIKIK